MRILRLRNGYNDPHVGNYLFEQQHDFVRDENFEILHIAVNNFEEWKIWK